MYLSIPDSFDNIIGKIAVFEQINNKIYTIEDIRIKDNTNLKFIKDENLIGTWKSVDYIYSKMINGYYILEKIS